MIVSHYTPNHLHPSSAAPYRARHRYHHCKTFIPTDMKQHCPLLLAGALAFAIINLSSCKKAFDYIDHHRDELAKSCQIQMVTYDIDQVSTPQRVAFSYDAKGNPVKIEAQDPNAFPYLAYHFHYDNKGRVSDFMQTDAKQTFVYIWHHYTYPTPKTIIDSEYEYAGDVNDSHPPYNEGLRGYVGKYTLDEKGRIIKYTQLYSPVSDAPYTYTVQYDANGNKVSPGPDLIYDDKVNIYQTNPVWQFIYGDYSRNNPYIPARNGLPATTSDYNQYGLPMVFFPVSSSLRNLFGFPFFKAEVTYACDLPKTPKDL